MRLNKLMLGLVAGASLFIGFVIISVAVGAAFPSMHVLSAPLICSGEVKVESIKYSYKPGQVGWENHIYCVERGKKSEITFPVIGVSGLVASAIVFILLVVVMRKSLISTDTARPGGGKR